MAISNRLFKYSFLACCSGLLLAGCADKRTVPLDVQLMTLLDQVCVVSPGIPTAENVTVNITFKDDGNGNLCPTDVDKECPEVFSGKKITFQAVDGSGNPFDDPPRFKVYFAPIQGKQLNGNNGSVSANIDDDVPKAIYKYTVWDWPQQGDPVCEPLDPNFRVNL